MTIMRVQVHIGPYLPFKPFDGEVDFKSTGSYFEFQILPGLDSPWLASSLVHMQNTEWPAWINGDEGHIILRYFEVTDDPTRYRVFANIKFFVSSVAKLKEMFQILNNAGQSLQQHEIDAARLRINSAK